ncbi:hypothetical protein KFL_002730190 [Klebsormidium nitens]|uniref:Uncharacterized protein n=1 Tax=Klebsormidium nitens TaxID=105231 RepID=A0A1Y1IAK9_KLENI|nr:hypothetical protein KFL_002730190 [Klebsormidium nitens]|eukprot:GAQ86161.1 hypothetical protein KFL_002730190 [Klebsormidium nitens]
MDTPFDRTRFIETSPYKFQLAGLVSCYETGAAPAYVPGMTSACVPGVTSEIKGCAEWGATERKRKRASGQSTGQVLAQNVNLEESGARRKGSGLLPGGVSVSIDYHPPSQTQTVGVTAPDLSLTELVTEHIQGLIAAQQMEFAQQGDGLSLVLTPPQLARLQEQHSEMRCALTFLHSLATEGSPGKSIRARGKEPGKPSATGLRRSSSEAGSITKGSGGPPPGASALGGTEAVLLVDNRSGEEIRGVATAAPAKRIRFGGVAQVETTLPRDGGVPLNHEVTGWHEASGGIVWGELPQEGNTDAGGLTGAEFPGGVSSLSCEPVACTGSYRWQSSDSSLQSGQNGGDFGLCPELPRVGKGFFGEDEWSGNVAEEPEPVRGSGLSKPVQRTGTGLARTWP